MRWLGEHSYLYSLAFNTVWSFFKTRLGVAAAERSGEAVATVEYAVPTREHTPTEIALANALLLRMHEFCEARGIRLIVLDIPTRVDERHARSSLAPDTRTVLDSAGIEYVDSEPLLGPYQGRAGIHVPHGYHHISETTHELLGAELARRLLPVQGHAGLRRTDSR